jgi:hypothetical protein
MKNYQFRVWQIKVKYFSLLLIGSFFMQSCSSGDGSPHFKDTEEIEVKTTSQGVISELEEVDPGNKYKVINEEIIDDKSASMAIVHNLDGTTDSLSFDELDGLEKEGESNGSRRHSYLRPFLMGTLAATYFNRNYNRTSLDPNRYKNTGAYNKSKGMRSTLGSTASTRRVTVPGKGSKGYGGSKSFRSFGG